MNVNSVVASVAVVGVTVAAVVSVVLFAAVAVIVVVDGAVVVVVAADVAGIVVDAAVAVVGVAEEAAVADAARHSFPNDVVSANQHLVRTAHHALLLSFLHMLVLQQVSLMNTVDLRFWLGQVMVKLVKVSLFLLLLCLR